MPLSRTRIKNRSFKKKESPSTELISSISDFDEIDGPGYILKESPIHGRGIFTTRTFNKDDDIEKGITFVLGLYPLVTYYFGRWLNHSKTPNSYLDWHDGVWWIKALTNIPKGVEITMNYNDTPWYIIKPDRLGITD